MSYEQSPNDHFEAATLYRPYFDNMPPIRVDVLVPRSEYYAEEVIRLSNQALSEIPSVNLGWDDRRAAVLMSRQLVLPNLSLYDLKDAADNSRGSRPINIATVAVLPASKEIDGVPNTPVEFYQYYPEQDRLYIARMDDLTEIDLEDPRFDDILNCELEFNPIDLGPKDRLVFYQNMLTANGESIVYNYETKEEYMARMGIAASLIAASPNN